MDVGFIGLGDQGGPMASAILAGGHRLHLWARRPEALVPYAAQGAITHDSVHALAEAVEHLGICVVDEEGVRELLFEQRGLAAMRPNSILAIHTTMAPHVCQEFAGLANGVGIVDAPVSGGREGALARRLLVMVGGRPAHVEAALPVFRCYAETVRHLGDLGAGLTAKLLNNLILNANFAVAHFALEYGAAAGLSRATLREVLLHGTAASTALDWLDRIVIPGQHPAALGKKDIALALELGVPVPREIETLAEMALAGRIALEKRS